jgi:hypothetical protein
MTVTGRRWIDTSASYVGVSVREIHVDSTEDGRYSDSGSSELDAFPEIR